MTKIFLDSVHGNIKIPADICKSIIDTPYFQRLRRIEQNSCRAVYPSARHDRFIHSLGVYHIGCQISNHLSATCDCLPSDWDRLKITYEMACLLHDVGHTPFSHTFEGFYDKDGLIGELRHEFNNDVFLKDAEIPLKKYTPHELLSAWLAMHVFEKELDKFGIDKELMVRMIIGLPYKDGDGIPAKDDFRNILIELIHGTIDADGLDYVCRDVWAGGYNSFNVNLDRLIESIDVKCEDGIYTLTFASKALNEIEAVLNVKNFQFLYVINHHKVLLEQHYLVEGVKSAAAYHRNNKDREVAIRQLCDYHAFSDGIVLERGYKLYRPCDDDFVCLMKQTEPGDEYIEQWFSRTHSYKPLWKTRIEFFHIFSDILNEVKALKPTDRNFGGTATSNACEMLLNSLDGDCKQHVIDYYKLNPDDIITIDIDPKLRQFDPEKIQIRVNGKPIDYSILKHDGFKVDGINAPYRFWYIDERILDLRGDIFDAIKSYMRERLINNQPKETIENTES